MTGNGYWHPYSHLVDYQIKHGHMKEAAAIQERLVVSAEKMDPRVDDQLATFYNLACFYAMAGELEKALTYLGRVLPRSAELREWSMKDPDLASLHGDEDFKALVDPGEG